MSSFEGRGEPNCKASCCEASEAAQPTFCVLVVLVVTLLLSSPGGLAGCMQRDDTVFRCNTILLSKIITNFINILKRGAAT